MANVKKAPTMANITRVPRNVNLKMVPTRATHKRVHTWLNFTMRQIYKGPNRANFTRVLIRAES